MKIIKDFLPPEFLDLVFKELNERRKINAWGISNLAWEKGLITNSSIGSVYTSLPNEQIEYLVKKFRGLPDIPNFTQLVANYYAWLPGSGIGLHNDNGRRFAATVYLNKNWHLNDGGIFLWEDKNTGKLEALQPSFNTVIINDSNEMHLVTPISAHVNVPRLTIQIFAYEN